MTSRHSGDLMISCRFRTATSVAPHYGTVLNIHFTKTNVAASKRLKPTRRTTVAGEDRCVMFDCIASAREMSGNAMSAKVTARAARRSDGNRERGASIRITIQTQASAEPNKFRP